MINRMTLVSARAINSLILAGVIGIAGAARLSAQSTGLDARWQAWLGCWQSSDSPANGQSSLVCVIPASAASSGVSIITFANGKELSREPLQAINEKNPVAKEGCNGWETAKWSADNRRLYLESELTCGGGLKRTSTGLMAMSAQGEWIDVKNIDAGGGSGLWGVRYRDAGIPAGLPSEISAALSARQLSVSTARVAAGAPIGVADIVDASKNVSPGLVQGWLVARGQSLKLDSRQITTLADNGVPGSVTDVLLALEYPKLFALDAGPFAKLGSAADSTGTIDTYPGDGRISNIYTGRYGYGGYGYGGYGYGGYGYGRNAGYGYSPYGYSPYGYSPYGYGYGGRAPQIIVTRGGQAAPRGRAINGEGYTRGSESDQRGRSSVSRPRSSAGSSGSSSSSGGSRPASSGGRTAKPRH